MGSAAPDSWMEVLNATGVQPAIRQGQLCARLIPGDGSLIHFWI